MSYAWADGRLYAEKLSEVLQERRLRVFLDDAQMDAGQPLRVTVTRALRRSSVLAVVVTDGSLASGHVANEIRAFVPSGRNIVPIVAPVQVEFFRNPPGGNPPDLPLDASKAEPDLCREFNLITLSKRIWLDESASVDLAQPDETVISKLRNSVGGFRRARIRSTFTTATAILFAALAAFAYAQRNVALEQRNLALARQLAASAPQTIGSTRNDERAALLARQAYLFDHEANGRSSVVYQSLMEVLSTRYFSSVLPLNLGWVNAFSEDGRYLVARRQRFGEESVLVHVALRSDAQPEITIKQDLGSAITLPVFSSDSNFLYVIRAGSVLEQWTLSDQDKIEKTNKIDLGEKAKGIALSGDNSTLGILLQNNLLIRVHSKDLQKTEASILTTEHIGSFALTADGDTIATASSDGRVRIYSWSSPEPNEIKQISDSPLRAVKFTPDDQKLVIGATLSVFLWSHGKEENPVHRLGETDGSVDNLAVSSSGDFTAVASGARDQGIRIWSLSPPFDGSVIPGPTAVTALAFSTDNEWLMSSDTGAEIRYWRRVPIVTNVGFRLSDFQSTKYQSSPFRIVKAPASSDFVVTGTHGVVQVWSGENFFGPPTVLSSLREQELLRREDLDDYVGPTITGGEHNYLLDAHIFSVAFAPDGKRFVTGDTYGTIHLWDIDHLEREPTVVDRENTNVVWDMAFHPTKPFLYTGSNRGHLRAWQVDPAPSLETDIELDEEATIWRVSLNGAGNIMAVATSELGLLLYGVDGGHLIKEGSISLEHSVFWSEFAPTDGHLEKYGGVKFKLFGYVACGGR